MPRVLKGIMDERLHAASFLSEDCEFSLSLREGRPWSQVHTVVEQGIVALCIGAVGLADFEESYNSHGGRERRVAAGRWPALGIARS